MSKDELERAMLDLLAIIHRDGGHYTQENGIRHSIYEANRTVASLHSQLEGIKQESK